MNIKRTVPLVKDIKEKIHRKTSLTAAAKAMGYTEGSTLRRVFREGEMPVDRLFALANLLDVSMNELVDHSKPLNNDTFGFMRWCIDQDRNKQEKQASSKQSVDLELLEARNMMLACAVITDFARKYGKNPKDVFDVWETMYAAALKKGDKK